MQILIFCTLSLKMPIHAPKIGVFWGFCQQNGEQYKRDPQKAHPWAETRRMTYRSSKSVHICALGVSRRIKLKKGIPKKPQHVFFQQPTIRTVVPAAEVWRTLVYVSGPRAWNSLQSLLHEHTDTFKRHLKPLLLQQAYHHIS